MNWQRNISVILRSIALAIASCIASAGCSTQKPLTQPLQRFEFTRLAMGVQARIVMYAIDEATATEAAAAGFMTIARLEAAMSDYRPDSELMQLCAGAGGPPVTVSDDLFRVLEAAQRLSDLSNGAFDVTVGPLAQLWREASRSGSLPSEENLNAARDPVDWRNVVLDRHARTVQLIRSGMSLDLGGIAKGYAASETVGNLRARGITRCLVAIAGDIAVGDPPLNEDGWLIALATGANFNAGDTLCLTNCSISTSGDTEQFVVIDGKRYSHIVDPRAGLGLTESIAVTVIATNGEIADGLSSALCVLGVEGVDLMKYYPHTAAVIEHHTAEGVQRVIIDPSGMLRWKTKPTISDNQTTGLAKP